VINHFGNKVKPLSVHAAATNLEHA